MSQFLQSYGLVVLIGLVILLVVLLTRSGRGMGGCCGGHQVSPDKPEEKKTPGHGPGCH
ncbi:MAG: hypothetical protein HYX96_08140 [Chloroflexi bacterium]|nr:hypothetical protein [Chloroflexota bacterium]